MLTFQHTGVIWSVQQETNIEKLRIGLRANIPDIETLFVRVADQLIADCR